MTIATAIVNLRDARAGAGRPPARLAGDPARPAGGLAAVWMFVRRERPLAAFLGSCAFIAGIILGHRRLVCSPYAAGHRRRGAVADGLDSSVPEMSLRIGLQWWLIGRTLAIIYFVVLFRLHAHTDDYYS